MNNPKVLNRELLVDVKDSILARFSDELITRFGVLVKEQDNAWRDHRGRLIEERVGVYRLSVNKLCRFMLGCDVQKTARLDRIDELTEEVKTWRKRYIEEQTKGDKSQMELSSHVHFLTDENKRLQDETNQATYHLGEAKKTLEQLQTTLAEKEATIVKKDAYINEVEAKLAAAAKPRATSGSTPDGGDSGDTGTDLTDLIAAYLRQVGPSTLSDIARGIGKDPSNVQKRLNILIEQGLVRKNEEDKTYEWVG